MEKTLILVRGVSGSGKTTFANMIAGLYESATHVAADDYYMVNGEYKFDASRLGHAHGYCKHVVEENMKRDNELLIVHNTFTRNSEMNPYFKLAEKYGYRVFSIIVENRHGNESVHNVPSEILESQKNRFSVKL